MLAENVSGNVRIDLYEEGIEVGGNLNNRFCKIMDLRTARSLAILLIDAIAKAEMEDAQRNKRKK